MSLQIRRDGQSKQLNRRFHTISATTEPRSSSAHKSNEADDERNPTPRAYNSRRGEITGWNHARENHDQQQ